MKREYNLVVMAGAMVLMILASCGKKTDSKQQEDTMSVSVLEVMEDSVMIRKSYPGVLQAADKAEVVARVNGTIRSQLYKPGDYVKQGQALFTIESTTYNDAVNQAQAQLATARATYDYATRHYQAMKKALEADAVAEMEVINAKSSMEQARASISSAQAALKDAQTRLGYCTVRAPISGYISDANLKTGSYVGGEGSAVVLATVYDNANMQVTFSIPDGAYIEMFTAGASTPRQDFRSMPITFSQPLQHDYSGAVSYLAPSVNSGTGTLELKANVANPYNELRDGMYATIALPYAAEPHALLVKDAAIQTDQRGQYVYTVDSNNKVVYTSIKTGELYHDTLRVVESGLKPGDLYVSKALLKVRPGMKVKPIRQ